jgi:hypothetical protein
MSIRSSATGRIPSPAWNTIVGRDYRPFTFIGVSSIRPSRQSCLTFFSPSLTLRTAPYRSFWTARQPGCSARNTLLLHLCEHALRVNHSFNRLILIYDIVMVLRSVGGTIDWNRLAAEAKASRLHLFLYCSLSIVRHYDTDAVPSEQLECLQPEYLPWGVRLFLRLQFRGMRIRGSSYLLYLAMNRGLLAKSVFLFRTFFPPAPIQRQRCREGHPYGIVPLYVLRIWEIVRHLFGVMLRHFGRR